MARGDSENATVPHPVDRFVGRRISERRIALGYNQGDLGRALGLTFQQVQKYEKGSNRVSASKLWLISEFLNVNVDYFFSGLSPATTEGDAMDGAGVATGDLDYPPTRMSVEMAALAPRLSSRRQKLTLELLRVMLEPEPQED